MNNDNKYVKLGFTIFCSLAAVILLYMGISNLAAVGGFLNVITSTLQPILIGLVLAYLVSPIQRKIENGLSDRRFKKNIARTISVFCTVLLMILICLIFLGVFLPQVINTITELAVSLPGMLNAFVEDINLNEYLRYNSQIIKFTEEAVDRFNEWFYEWMHSGIFSTLNSVLVGVLNTFGFVINIVVGFIVMIYVLFEKDHFCGQAKKILYACSKNRRVNAFILDTVRQCDKMFGGFISGSIMDSCLIGVICFFVLWILNVPYFPLISLIVGVTNVIPFFGPYIGAIPSALLILLADPMKCVQFVIFILILQQVDGNIIAPKILGQSTGLSPFWVLFSILIFGELFGVLGMIIGVPLFATIYYVVKRLVESNLTDQGLPTDTKEYIYLDKLDYDNRASFLKQPKHGKKKKTKEKKESEQE